MEQGPTVGLFIRLPEREADQLRRHAMALDVTSSRLIRMIVHARLEDARRDGQLTFTTPGGKHGSGK
jgi:hypothetical protein